jgi:hypothetical protein
MVTQSVRTAEYDRTYWRDIRCSEVLRQYAVTCSWCFPLDIRKVDMILTCPFPSMHFNENFLWNRYGQRPPFCDPYEKPKWRTPLCYVALLIRQLISSVSMWCWLHYIINLSVFYPVRSQDTATALLEFADLMLHYMELFTVSKHCDLEHQSLMDISKIGLANHLR